MLPVKVWAWSELWFSHNLNDSLLAEPEFWLSVAWWQYPQSKSQIWVPNTSVAGCVQALCKMLPVKAWAWSELWFSHNLWSQFWFVGWAKAQRDEAMSLPEWSFNPIGAYVFLWHKEHRGGGIHLPLFRGHGGHQTPRNSPPQCSNRVKGFCYRQTDRQSQ